MSAHNEEPGSTKLPDSSSTIAPISHKKPPSFADSFWSSDYLSGINVLFDKLEQGVMENSQILDFVSNRISLESAYASKLESTTNNVLTSKSSTSGFDRDEGASIKQAFLFFLDESSNQGELHSKIAANLERSVRGPFSDYAAAHKKRINTARQILTTKIKSYNKSADQVHKAQQSYYAKARQLEELTNSSVPVIVTSPLTSPLRAAATNSSINKRLSLPHQSSTLSSTKTQSVGPNEPQQEPSSKTDANAPTINVTEPASFVTPVKKTPKTDPRTTAFITLGGTPYNVFEFNHLIKDCLASIPRETVKVPILGNYNDVSTGDVILQYIRTAAGRSNLGAAEQFGQDLVNNGYLRSVGTVKNTFIGSSGSRYQWTKKALEFSPDSILGQNDLDPSDNETSESSNNSSINGTTIAESALETTEAAAAAFAKRTSTIVSGYFSNLLNTNEEVTEAQTPKSEFGHKRQQSMGFPLSSGSKINGHSRTFSFSVDSSLSAPRRESQISKLQREIEELDKRYQELVLNLDEERCNLEQSLYETLSFVQQCERDRLIAVKTVLSDFTVAVGRTINSLQDSVKRMAMHQSMMDPLKDLNYLIERYKTGPFCPKPIVYKGFFQSLRVQCFGVDLKFAPHVIESFIKFLATEEHIIKDSKALPPLPDAAPPKEDAADKDNSDSESQHSDATADFPSVAVRSKKEISAIKTEFFYSQYISKLKTSVSREVLVSLWSGTQSPVTEIQELRRIINTTQQVNTNEILINYSPQVVISTLREFLLELPDTIISSTIYDVIKSTYSKFSPRHQSGSVDEEDEALQGGHRLERLVGLLSHLPHENLNGLKLLTDHFADICEFTRQKIDINALPQASQKTTLSPPRSPPSSPNVSTTIKMINILPESQVPANVKELSRSIASYLLRPRTVTALTMTDKHPQELVQDLILYGETLFKLVEDRLEGAKKAKIRSRSGSYSESSRRQHVEERNRALAASAAAKLQSFRSASPANVPAMNAQSHSPPRNGPLPLTLSSGALDRSNQGNHSNNSSTSSNHSYLSTHSRNNSGSSLHETLSNNGSTNNLHPGRTVHRRSSSSKLSIRSFLEPQTQQPPPVTTQNSSS